MMPTASSIERAMLCAASAVLPSVDKPNAAARRGTKLHSEIQGALMATGETDINIEPLIDRLDTWLPEIELAIAYDADKDEARVLGVEIERNYGEVSPSDVCMSLDVCGGNNIIEIKTGKYPVAPPAYNWQLKTQAIGLARARGLSAVNASIAMLSGKEFAIESTTFTALDLDWISDDLRQLRERVAHVESEIAAGREAPVSPSDQACQFCKCKKVCPAYGA